MPPTDTWLSYSPLPPLNGAEGVAERLVLLLHHGADFDVWGGARRPRYWSALAERVKAATYAGPTLMDWWGQACSSLPSSPRDEAEREEVAALLGVEEGKEVLSVLRKHADVLVLRARVVSDRKRVARESEVSENE